jgi:hypothetical protein
LILVLLNEKINNKPQATQQKQVSLSSGSTPPPTNLRAYLPTQLDCIRMLKIESMTGDIMKITTRTTTIG